MIFAHKSKFLWAQIHWLHAFCFLFGSLFLRCFFHAASRLSTSAFGTESEHFFRNVGIPGDTRPLRRKPAHGIHRIWFRKASLDDRRAEIAVPAHRLEILEVTRRDYMLEP